MAQPTITEQFLDVSANSTVCLSPAMKDVGETESKDQSTLTSSAASVVDLPSSPGGEREESNDVVSAATSDLELSSGRGRKRTREMESMDHSGMRFNPAVSCMDHNTASVVIEHIISPSTQCCECLSGLEGEHKIPRALLRLGAKQCLSVPSLDDLKELTLSECGRELARSMDEVREGKSKM